MTKYKDIVNDIIESSNDNSSGTLLNSIAIHNLIERIIHDERVYLTHAYIDKLIDEYQTDSGYLIKANDIIYSIQIRFLPTAKKREEIIFPPFPLIN